MMQREIAHRGPYVARADGKIDCLVKFKAPHPLAPEGWLPYTADPGDIPEAIGPALHAELANHPKLAPAAAPNDVAIIAEVRRRRDQLLRDTDWSQGADVPEATRAKWAPYRQALRDITKGKGFPETVGWPSRP